jgi:hypothetical protein
MHAAHQDISKFETKFCFDLSETNGIQRKNMSKRFCVRCAGFIGMQKEEEGG